MYGDDSRTCVERARGTKSLSTGDCAGVLRECDGVGADRLVGIGK